MTPAAPAESLRRIVAVCGCFDPFALGVPDDAMGELAADCDEMVLGGRYRWIMRAGARRAVLAAIEDRGALERLLAAAPPPDPDDAFGQALHRVLRAEQAPLLSRSWQALGRSFRWLLGETIAGPEPEAPPQHEQATHMALAFARAIPALAERGPELDRAAEELGHAIAQAERERELDVALDRRRRLIGRAVEQRAIAAFIDGRAGARPLLLTGIGGAGKSALVATVIRPLNRSPDKTAILIDCDRPRFATGEPFELFRAVTRQLRADIISRHPQVAAILKEMRAALKTGGAGAGGPVRVDPREQLGMLDTLVFAPMAALPEDLRNRPVLLVIDTFEVVAALGDAVVDQVLTAEAMLRERGGLRGLRTLISGRSIESAMAPFLDRLAPREQWLSMEGLTPPEGAELLADEKVGVALRARAQRERATAALKGHPLALKVLALYCRGKPQQEVEDLLADVEAHPGLQAELAQRYLYTRILGRIVDPEVRKLAHPGLVLRHVSPDLIRLVLAQPCDLGDMDDARAVALFRKLVAQHWLVEAVGADHARHRPDLRRQMLGSMLAPPRTDDREAARKAGLVQKAAAVSRAAIRLYRDGPPEGDPARGWWTSLPETDRRREALYHTALVEPAPETLPAEDARLLRTLGEDFESLPQAWQALAKAASGGYESLSDADRETLSGGLRAEAETTLIRRQQQAGASREAGMRAAAEYSRRMAEDAQAAPQAGAAVNLERDFELIDQQVRSAFARSDLAEAAELAEPMLAAFCNADRFYRERPTIHFTPDASFWQSGLWLGALATAAIGERPAFPRIEYTDFSTRTYGQLAAIFSLHLLLHRDAAQRIRMTDAMSVRELMLLETEAERRLRAAGPDLVRELHARRTRMGTIDRSRLFAVYLRLHAEIDPDQEFEVSAAELALLSPTLEKLADPQLARAGQDRWNIVFPNGLMVAKAAEITRRDLDGLDDRAVAVIRRAEVGWDTKTLMSLLRGTTAELYEPIGMLMRPLAPDVVAGLVTELATHARLWPTDLHFAEEQGGHGSLVYSPHDVHAIVTTADRCGLLERLLDLLMEHDPRAHGLRNAAHAITERLFRS